MTASYWVAKYVEDPFRNETRNVGVIVSLNGVIRGRFVGERDDGTLDQRKLRGLAHPVAYTQWRDFWRRKIAARDLEAVERAVTANFAVAMAGEVSDTQGDNAAEVCHFLFNLVVGAGPTEAFEWEESEDAEVDLASDIAASFEDKAILARQNKLFATYPVKKGEHVRGRHVTHTPSFSQRNGRLYVMEYIDLGARKINKAKERAGWMAYMFSDIRDIDHDCRAYSLVRPEGENHSDQIDYARNVLAGESTIVNWADDNERHNFLVERMNVAEPELYPTN